MSSIKIFFCYAHEDENFLNKLKTSLNPLQRGGLIDMWHDRDINAGSEWELEIKKHLSAAQIILLLISPDFMASNYCYGVEMKQAIARHGQGIVRVIPIILRPVHWQIAPFGKLQALPTNAEPVTHWSTSDDAFFNVAEGIRQVVDGLLKKTNGLQEGELSTDYSVSETRDQNIQIRRLNEKLKAARKSYGWTREELAKQIGAKAFAIKSWEDGNTMPPPNFKKKLCQLLQMTSEELGIVVPKVKTVFDQSEERTQLFEKLVVTCSGTPVLVFGKQELDVCAHDCKTQSKHGDCLLPLEHSDNL